jgi:hypothetical protein
MIKLQVKCGDSSREMELSQDEISVGRSADNVIALDDKKSSRRHAVIRKDGDQYRLVDEMSGNGTRVNGKDVNTHVLAQGDVISIGLSTLTVTLLDAPSIAKLASAPAAAKAEGGAPHAPPLTRHTRRDRYVRKSGSGQLVAFAAAALVIVAVGYVLFQKADTLQLKPASKPSGGAREAAAAVASFKSRATAETPTDALIAEGAALADRNPELEPVVADLKRRRAEQIGKMTFGQVEGLVKAALSERRFGDALDALKALKGTPDGAQAAALAEKVTEEIRKEFQSVDEQGRKLASERKYGAAAEHYRAQAKHFRSTEHFRYLNNKPEALDELAKAEAAAEAAKTARASQPKETLIAKAPEPASKPAEPKPEMPAPKPAEPKPEAPAPKPAMPAKPEPKPAPKPPEPKPAPKPPEPEKPKEEAKPAEGPAPRYKKPDVLCDCKKIVKGTHCVKCERTLGEDDIRNGVCKKCEEKPKKIDLCVKRYFQAECHPEKISDRPVTCDGKVYDFPHEDKARVVYLCSVCDEWGDLQGEIKHKAECKNRLATQKICLKSGQGAHAPKEK